MHSDLRKNMIGNQLPADGASLSARYAFMPNRLRYCGGERNGQLFDYVTHKRADAGLLELLSEFATMYPYLKLIADSNRLLDPFSYRVAEAYWLGNELLNNVSMNNFYRYMVDEQKLPGSFKPQILDKVFGKIPQGAKPHHSWHVFNIPKRTGHYPVEHSLETMELCRITPAQVVRVEPGKLEVVYRPLSIENNRLILGDLTTKQIATEFNGRSFVDNPEIGDWVSLHWDWVCDILTQQQAMNLQKWTTYNLKLANI